MIDFSINFSVLGRDYQANVHRIGSNPVQYHVSKLIPSNIEIPTPYTFLANQTLHKFDYPSFGFNYSRQIGSAISKALFNACEEKGIPVYDENYNG